MDLPDRVSALRAFNRFWTARIGALDAHLLDTPYSLAEARVLFELAHAPSLGVSQLREQLRIDPGYLSRILGRLARGGLVALARASDDARRQIAKLTSRGRSAYRTLDRRAAADVTELLAARPDAAQERTIAAMAEIRRALGERTAPPALVLRAPAAGDLGWIVERHGTLYAREYGWDVEFEALVASIVAEYGARRDSRREACWIAELDGERVGCVMCVRKSARIAQLRLLLVEPTARGHGIGARLVAECVRFARERGYQRIMLWTNDVLDSARRIYEAAGFALVASGPHTAFGHDLVEQTWELVLREPRTP